ncbi:hypothetical protein PIB30_006840 [Stylosanthes scabra]|uniref:Uncharacterized protein n=1 Tax=Stylosanthes scabra TaxID=79078 RepID=A0ABU6V3E7_9FABA|nr:hypothetical protein [Stylosanthes scabra]
MPSSLSFCLQLSPPSLTMSSPSSFATASTPAIAFSTTVNFIFRSECSQPNSVPLAKLVSYRVEIDGEKLDQRYPNLHLDSGGSIVETISTHGQKKQGKPPRISAPPMRLSYSKIAMLKWTISSRCRFR